jgi:hypothetical protein
MSETETYTIKYMTGVIELKPIKHVATWKSHELFDMTSDYMTVTDADDIYLSMARTHGMLIEFTNQRPARKNWLQRLFAA